MINNDFLSLLAKSFNDVSSFSSNGEKQKECNENTRIIMTIISENACQNGMFFFVVVVFLLSYVQNKRERKDKIRIPAFSSTEIIYAKQQAKH